MKILIATTILTAALIGPVKAEQLPDRGSYAHNATCTSIASAVPPAVFGTPD
jgi:hypothetical protein